MLPRWRRDRNGDEPDVPARHAPPSTPDVVDVERLTRDPLTGVAAAWLLDDRVELAVRRLSRSGRLAALLVIDIDRFEVVNQTLGTSAGDELLRAVATRVRARVRDGDTIGRIGGDEFAVLVDELSGTDEAGAVADAILASLREPFDLGDGTAVVSASIGYVLVDGTEPTAELWRRTDLALARAKRRGGGRYAAYDERTTHAVDPDLELEWALRRRLDDGRVRFRYRPVVELRTGSLAFVASTLAPGWPEVGLLEEADVRRVASAAGLAERLFRLEVTAAAQQAVTRPGRASVSVDVPIAALAAGRVDRAVSSAVEQAGIPAGSLLLVVGVDGIDTAPPTVEQLVRLADAGVELGLRVGSHATLDSLRTVPANVLVLDGGILDDLRSDRTRAVAGAVLGIAEVLDAVVVAAEVDDDDRLEAARSLGVDLVHGDRIGGALDAGDLGPWLSASPTRG